MSGKPWGDNPQRRATHGRRVRRRWRNGGYANRQTTPISRAEREARSTRMKLLNARMRDDEQLKAKCVRGQKRVRRAPAYRAIQAAVMTEIMSRPEMRRTARYHAIKINKNPRTRKKQWATRRRKKQSTRPALPATMMEQVT